jgi:hypothetical protein
MPNVKTTVVTLSHNLSKCCEFQNYKTKSNDSPFYNFQSCFISIHPSLISKFFQSSFFYLSSIHPSIIHPLLLNHCYLLLFSQNYQSFVFTLFHPMLLICVYFQFIHVFSSIIIQLSFISHSTSIHPLKTQSINTHMLAAWAHLLTSKSLEINCQ